MNNKDAIEDLQLIIAEKQEIINQLTHDKNSLLKIISHDIRGPFNQLFALLQLMELEMPELVNKNREYIDKMYQSIISGMEMVKNLHDTRAIDQGNITLNSQEIELSGIINQAIKGFRIQCKIKKIKIESAISENSIPINSDPILFKKMLDCVISNAIKFSEPDSTVFLTLSRKAKGLELAITDTGPGIPEKELAMVFDKFSKLSTKPTMGESASGLGMYLAKYFSTVLGFKIQVENVSNNGGLKVSIIL